MRSAIKISLKCCRVVMPVLFAINQPLYCASAKKTHEVPCEIPACEKTYSMMKKAFALQQSQKDHTRESEIVKTRIPEIYRGCPADRKVLGDSTWTLLHTMAAFYPEIPTDEQRHDMMQFITVLAKFYPCPHCAEDFQESVKNKPPR